MTFFYIFFWLMFCYVVAFTSDPLPLDMELIDVLAIALIGSLFIAALCYLIRYFFGSEETEDDSEDNDENAIPSQTAAKPKASNGERFLAVISVLVILATITSSIIALSSFDKYGVNWRKVAGRETAKNIDLRLLRKDGAELFQRIDRFLNNPEITKGLDSALVDSCLTQNGFFTLGARETRVWIRLQGLNQDTETHIRLMRRLKAHYKDSEVIRVIYIYGKELRIECSSELLLNKSAQKGKGILKNDSEGVRFSYDE